MTGDEWKDYKDFDELSRDMNGLFAERYTPYEIIAGRGSFLTAENSAKRSKQNKPVNLYPPAAQ